MIITRTSDRSEQAMASQPVEPRPVDYRRKWHVAAAVASTIFLGTFSGVQVALPVLVEEMDTEFAIVQWVLLAYTLTVGTLLIAAGRFGDLWGKKRLCSVGVAVFILGSLLCGLAPSIGWLIAARVLQGVGYALMAALAHALLTEAFPESERGKALSVSTTVAGLGFILGPAVGGLLITQVSWRAVFLILVPLGLLCAYLVYRYLPSSRPRAAMGRFDYAGTAALFALLLTLLAAFNLGQRDGFRSPLVGWLFAAFGASLILFLRFESRSPAPMIPLRAFRSRELNVYLVTGLLTFLSLYGTPFLLVFYLTNVLGLKSSLVGGLVAVLPIALAVVSPISGVLSDRVGFRAVSAVGLATLAVGFWLASLLGEDTTPLSFVLLTLPIGVGVGLFVSPNSRAVMGAVPPDQRGLASGLLSQLRTIGQATGIVILGALWSSRVGHHGGLAQEITRAPAEVQVAGFRDTFLALSVLMLVALAVVLWEWVGATREQRALALAAERSAEETSP